MKLLRVLVVLFVLSLPYFVSLVLPDNQEPLFIRYGKGLTILVAAIVVLMIVFAVVDTAINFIRNGEL